METPAAMFSWLIQSESGVSSSNSMLFSYGFMFLFFFKHPKQQHPCCFGQWSHQQHPYSAVGGRGDPRGLGLASITGGLTPMIAAGVQGFGGEERHTCCEGRRHV